MEELEELPTLRQGPFGYEFPGDQPPPQASGPPLLNPSEDRVLAEFIHGVGSDQGWLDDELLILVDDSKSTDSTNGTRSPRPPPIQHIMTSLPAPNARCFVPAHPIFQEPPGLSDVGFRDATTFVLPTTHPYANNLPNQVMPRDARSALHMNHINYQANVNDPNHFYVHHPFGPINHATSVEYSHSTYSVGADGQDAWPSHEYPGQSSGPVLGSTRPNLDQRGIRENLVQFGSDLRFAKDHFEAPDHHQTEARLRATMLGQVQNLFTKGKIGGSPLSSPDANRSTPRSPVRRIDIVNHPTLAVESERCSSPVQESCVSLSTRPRSTATKKGKSAASSAVVKSAARSRKNKGKRHTNLSNEQRVDNHRQSEQRRRDEIRNSYIAMKATIPGMGDKKTKGAEMQYTVTWMRQTLKENEKLLNLLESITRGN
ncbi:MAG: hypothetical protein LQ337_005092 [Flavoplaca oasis]|nr:MAG: hypothetical protein LQ337_005092 [Flavoplaca oasis]